MSETTDVTVRPVPKVLQCPQCKAVSVKTLAMERIAELSEHLHTEHGLDAESAVARAREVADEATSLAATVPAPEDRQGGRFRRGSTTATTPTEETPVYDKAGYAKAKVCAECGKKALYPSNHDPTCSKRNKPRAAKPPKAPKPTGHPKRPPARPKLKLKRLPRFEPPSVVTPKFGDSAAKAAAVTLREHLRRIKADLEKRIEGITELIDKIL